MNATNTMWATMFLATTATIGCAATPPTSPSSEDAWQRIEAVRSLVQATATHIQHQLDGLGDRSQLKETDWVRAWAGRYYAGDGLGFNHSLLVGPEGDITSISEGCMGVYGAAQYRVTEVLPDGLRTKLVLDDSATAPGVARTDRWYFVKWGQRRYLVQTDLMNSLCNEFNQGLMSEYGGSASSIPLREEDRGKMTSGLPLVPSAFAKCLHPLPLKICITKVEDAATHNATGHGDMAEAKLTLDGGAAAGAFVGMELWFGGQDDYGRVSITEVGEHESRATYQGLSLQGKPAPLPVAKDVLNTGRDIAGHQWPGLEAADGTPSGLLLIISPRAFHEVLQDFAAFKRGELSTDLVDLETVLETMHAHDDAAKLKDYLWGRWSRLNEIAERQGSTEPRLRYVLLVGDADTLPVRYMCLDRNTDAAFNYAFYPSDLYYADLTKPNGDFEDWNGNKDDFHAGYFGEVRGEHNKSDPINFDHINYKPTIAVGRWPVSTPEEVKTIADKTMAYERSIKARREAEGESGKKPVAAMIAVGGWVENKGPMDAMAAKLLAHEHWSIEKRYEGGGEGMKPPSAAEVVSLLNGGTQLIFHTGHGEPNSWAGSFGVGQISKLNNAAHPAIMLSAGCSTAFFATLPPYQPYVDIHGVEHKGTDAGEMFTAPPPPPSCYAKGTYNMTGLGERLLRDGPNGAVAYFGCNTGSQPCGMTLLDGFADAVGAAGDKPVRLGDCWMHAVSYYYDQQHLAEIKPNDDWYPPSIFFQGMKFMLFGDPSIPMP